MEITPELQAVIDAAVADATKGLKEKRDELLKANKDLATAKTTAEQAAETASEEAQRKAGDITALETTLNNKHSKALKALQDQLDAANKRLSTVLIDDTITKGLVAANVPAKFHKALTSQFKAEAALNDGVAKLGDEPLSDYLISYFKTDEGKEWVAAPVNQGTGATGVTNALADRWTKKPTTPDEHFRFAQLSLTDPALFNSLCDRFGEPERKV